MADLAPAGSQFGAEQSDSGMGELLDTEEEELFTSYDEVYKTFDAMNLKEDLLMGISKYGFEKPSAIQQMVIVPLCKGLDVFAHAESEPGRTATFCIGILQQLDYNLLECQCLVLTSQNTSEIMSVMQALGQHLGLGVKVLALESNCGQEMNNILRKGVHVVVGYPRDVPYMLENKFICPDHIKMVIFDDVILASGCKADNKIFKLLPPKVQVGAFLKTMSPKVVDFTREFMYNPVRVVVKQNELTLEGIKHFVVNVKEEYPQEKFAELVELLKKLPANTQCVIFAHNVPRLSKILLGNKKFTCAAIYQEMDQNYRDSIMRKFRDGVINMVIGIDSYTRGFEFEASLVINFDLPFDAKGYLERVGRFGRKGAAINFANEENWSYLFEFQTAYDIDFEQLPPDISTIIRTRSGQPTLKHDCG